MTPKPLVMTSKKYPSGALRRRSMMIRRRLLESACRDQAVAVAQPRMTRRAINVEALVPPVQHFFGHREWHVVARIVSDFPSVEIASSWSSPRATVPSTGGRAERRSAKKSLCASGFSAAGRACHDGRPPPEISSSPAGKNVCEFRMAISSAPPRSARGKPFQKLAGGAGS